MRIHGLGNADHKSPFGSYVLFFVLNYWSLASEFFFSKMCPNPMIKSSHGVHITALRILRGDHINCGSSHFHCLSKMLSKQWSK